MGQIITPQRYELDVYDVSGQGTVEIVAPVAPANTDKAEWQNQAINHQEQGWAWAYPMFRPTSVVSKLRFYQYDDPDFIYLPGAHSPTFTHLHHFDYNSNQLAGFDKPMFPIKFEKGLYVIADEAAADCDWIIWYILGQNYIKNIR